MLSLPRSLDVRCLVFGSTICLEVNPNINNFGEIDLHLFYEDWPHKNASSYKRNEGSNSGWIVFSH